MILNFLKLYRLNVAIITVVVYFFGVICSDGFGVFNYYNLLISVLISFISINFIYSLNSWFDADIDKINKPNRPIPAGLVTKKQAFLYSIVLGALSFIYPMVMFFNSNIKFLFFIFILIGILYSNKVFSFKKNKFLGLTLIFIGIATTLIIGYLVNGGNINENQIIYFLFILFILFWAIIPLKDITDIKGDKLYNLDNWFIGTKENRIFFLSNISSVISIILALFLKNIFLSSIITIYASSIIFLFVTFFICRIDFKKFYTTLLSIFILDGIIVLFLL